MGLAEFFREQNVQAMKDISEGFNFLSLGPGSGAKGQPSLHLCCCSLPGTQLQLKAAPCFRVL